MSRPVLIPLYGLVLLGILLLAGAGGCKPVAPEESSSYQRSPGKVQVYQTEQGYGLSVEGKPFVVKGASGREYWEELAVSGGNTVRTYDLANLDSLLDRAQVLDLKVIAGLAIPPIRQGYDYGEEAFVETLIQSTVDTVAKYRDHPALLIWVAGNEVNLLHPDNLDYWKATDRLVRAIHQADPDHPVMVSVNDMLKNYRNIQRYAPSIDVLGLNIFGAVERMKKDLARDDTWQGPVLFAEWAPEGYWEALQTDWSAPIEQSDQVKASSYEIYYQTHIQPYADRCLGSLVFYWGQKQERTQTWFSLFSEQGERTPVVDLIQRMWTAEAPANRVPMARAMVLNDQEAGPSLTFAADSWIVAEVFPHDPDGDSLSITWELLPEGEYQYRTGGDREPRPEPVEVTIEQDQHLAWFLAPKQTGAYRLFVYVRDGKGGMGYHNVPFFLVKTQIRRKG